MSFRKQSNPSEVPMTDELFELLGYTRHPVDSAHWINGLDRVASYGFFTVGQIIDRLLLESYRMGEGDKLREIKRALDIKL